MLPQIIQPANYLMRMPDGTVKQMNPFTGTEVWTVPGRGHRPLGNHAKGGQPLDPEKHDAACAFCARRLLETPPEKARLVRNHDGWETLKNLAAEKLFETHAEFRRVPNLFEIVSWDYWQKNFGYTLPEALAARKLAYVSTDAGRRHVLDVIETRLRLSGMDAAELAAMPVEDKLAYANAFFGGGHELVIGRRHFADGAETDVDLCSSGVLSADEHYQYFRFTIEAVRDIYLANRYVRYVAVFQNWLSPAGASFDHLHKQLVAIDERGVYNDMEIRLARENPNIYNEAAVNFAAYRNLVFAENDHAVAFAGFGHRFPTLEIYSKGARSQPWNHSAEELRGVSDLVHACHAAMGSAVPCNEEWHYKPPDADVPMPWRTLIKWRISNPAGFEGGTRIYVNTIDPEGVRDKVLPRLFRLREEGAIASMRIGPECVCVPNCLKYNPAVRHEDRDDPEFPPLSGEARPAGA
jgi:galactose-1-phosphate uridylyltransferase